MNVLGFDYTRREFTFLCLLLIVTIGFLLSAYAHEHDIKALRTTTSEAVQKFNDCNNGYMKMTATANGVFIPNMTLSDLG